MTYLQRIVAPMSVGALVLTGVGAVAHAEDVEPPADTAPIVGMAFEEGSTTLWLAGVDANDGIVTAADDGREVSFSGNPESVQALAWKDDRLWIGDIGDVNANREYVVVYRLNSVAEDTSPYNAFDFEYPDGPQDAKAMLISGRGRIHIVTAGENPGIYRGPVEASRQDMNVLERVGDAPAGVTDGAFMADGTTMVLRTAEGLQYIDALTWETVVTETLVGAESDESVTVNAEDVVYVGGNPTIRTGTMPSADTTTTVGASPEPEASTSESAEATASSAPASPQTSTSTGRTVDDVEAAEQVSTTSPGRIGTLVALIAAALVALTAGAVVALRR